MKQLFLFTCLFVISCKGIQDGYVVDKEDIPEYVSHDFQPLIVGKTTTYIPVTHYHPECFTIKIMKLRPHSRKFDYNTFVVSKETFGSVQVNQYVKFK